MEYVKILHVYIKPLLHVILHSVNIKECDINNSLFEFALKNSQFWVVLSLKTTSLRYQCAFCNLINFMCWIEIGLFDRNLCAIFSTHRFYPIEYRR